ncbi:MAG: class I SAM-dependent methyltransferase [Alicyclobacillaceae bacterium]|nr:class I SAM-dependent methyltransferase [Alicyclobacillaceae bacterium]
MIDHTALNGQQSQWEGAFAKNNDMFGEAPSQAAIRAAGIFREHGAARILELGAGQGRDTLYFAQHGFDVTVLDYTKEGIERIQQKAEDHHLASQVHVCQHDVRHAFPFSENSFDAVYSHMLYCMAFTTRELEAINQHACRVLKPRGLNIYTVRHKGDAHFGQGVHRGEDMYEVGGFIVHFFDRAKVDGLAEGYHILDVHEFEEGGLPRRLFQVTLEKDSIHETSIT